MSDNNHEIKEHNFENAKNALKIFSKKIPKSPNLPTVPTDGFFWGTSYSVTGGDLNKLSSIVQIHLVETNKQVINLIREFEQIYETFESLDRDYIQGMLAGIAAAQIASEQALNAATKASEALEKTTIHTNEIDNLVKIQAVAIQKLVSFNDEQAEKINRLSFKVEDIQNEVRRSAIDYTEHIQAQETLISKQSEENKDLHTEVEKLRNALGETESRFEKTCVAQGVMFARKIKIAYALSAALGAVAVINLGLNILNIA